MKRTSLGMAVLALPCLALGNVIVSQTPVSGGGVTRWSQLWQDPQQQNNLDGDSVCWQDIVLPAQASINHIEWWGTGACDQGFQIEVWRQDPGTVAYQPLAVFYYGENPNPPQPQVMFRTTSYTTTPGPGGINHYTLDLATPINLPANDASNPRWFIGIVGLTTQAYYTWNWAQGTGGSARSFQFIRGGSPAGGPLFLSLHDGRAILLSGTMQTPCYANCDGSTIAPILNVNDFTCFLNKFAAGDPAANCDGSTIPPILNVNDFTCFINLYAAGCP